MTKYEYLPIFKSAMDLALEMEKTVRNMSRYDKYEIRTELRERYLALLSFILQSNSTDKIKEILEEIRITMEELKQLLFLGKETKALSSFYIFKKLMEQAEAVAKQNEEWQNTNNVWNVNFNNANVKNNNPINYYVLKGNLVRQGVFLHIKPSFIPIPIEEIPLEISTLSVYYGIDSFGYFCKLSHTLVRRLVARNLKKALAESLNSRGDCKSLSN